MKHTTINTDLTFDPFAPPPHLTLDLAPVENLFGDSSSEQASEPTADELMFFGNGHSAFGELAPAVPPPPPLVFDASALVAPVVAKKGRGRKSAAAKLQEQQQQQQQQQAEDELSTKIAVLKQQQMLAMQQQMLALQFQQAQPQFVPQPMLAPTLPIPAVPAMLLSTTAVLTEDDDYVADADADANSDGESDDGSADSAAAKPRVRRAAAKGALTAAQRAAAAAGANDTDSQSSGDEAPSNSKKRKGMSAAASMGGAPQRTQLTKAELELGATLDLSRDELLNMTSEALEEHAKRLASQRTLTSEEQKRFKRQRRLIKNRESAQLSRMRKKAYVDELERQIADLKEEKNDARRRADNAERQLAQMRAETAQLRALLTAHPALAALAAAPPSVAVAVPPPPPSSVVGVELPADDAVEQSKRRRGAGGLALL